MSPCLPNTINRLFPKRQSKAKGQNTGKQVHGLRDVRRYVRGKDRGTNRVARRGTNSLETQIEQAALLSDCARQSRTRGGLIQLWFHPTRKRHSRFPPLLTFVYSTGSPASSVVIVVRHEGRNADHYDSAVVEKASLDRAERRNRPQPMI